MAANKPVWGIDIGQCALKAICLRSSGDQVEVVHHFLADHAMILSQPDADPPALIAEAVRKLTEAHDLSKATLVVGVPGQNTLARFIKLPPVEKKKIPEIVKYEAQQQIPFDMEEVIWDYQVFEQPEAMETAVGIFAMRRELLREHLRYLSVLNLEPSAVQSAPLALYNALKYDGAWEDGSATILDIGAENTDLVIADGDSLWTRNIPIGGNNFTEALLKTFKLSFRKAEKLKRDAQKHKYARQIFQAMRPVFADLVAEIQRSIGFYSSSRRGAKLGKIIAMGNAFKLPGMVKFIQQNLGMEVVRPTSFKKLSARDAPDAPQLIDNLLSFGVAYGLALQGLGETKINSSLLPPEIAKQIVWRKKTPWFYGSAACLLLAAGIVWARSFADGSVVEAATAGIAPPVTDVAGASRIVQGGPPADLPAKAYAETVQSAGRQMQTALDEISRENEQRIREAEQITSLRTSRAVWPNLLDMIHGALPEPQDKALAEALKKGPQAYRALVESDPAKYARGKREQVFIQHLDASYHQDAATAYLDQTRRSETRMRGGAGYAMPDGAGGTMKAGFLIELTLRTPHEDNYTFIEKAFLSKLRDAARPGLHVHAYDLLLRQQVGREGMEDLGVGGPGRDGGGSSFRSRDLEVDPVTGEPVGTDWECKVVLAVMLADKPQPPAGAAGADSGLDGGS